MNTQLQPTRTSDRTSDLVSLSIIVLGAIAGVAALLVCSDLVVTGQAAATQREAKASDDAYVLRATLASHTLHSTSIQ